MSSPDRRRPATRGGRPGAAPLPLLLLLAAAAAACCAPRAAARQLASAASAPAPQQLHIVHVNDVHNRIEQTSTSSTGCTPANAAAGVCLGGWARISSYVKAARKAAAAQKAGFLFLDAGDQFDGTLWDVVYRGYATAMMQNIVKPDAMTLGNHEFTYPAETLKNYVGNLTFPMLGACNVDSSSQPLLEGLFKKYEVFKFGPYKVAAVGWLTPDTAWTALHGNMVQVAPVNPAVKACIRDLKQEHPDVHMIIGMSHTGYTPDLLTAKEVPELDLIIGGHSHTFLQTPTTVGPILDKTVGATAANCEDKRACDVPTGPYPTFVDTQLCTGSGAAKQCKPKSVPVVQAFYASKYIGDLKIDLPSKKIVASKVVLLGGSNSTSPWPKDPEILAKIEELSLPVQALETKTVGKVDELLIGGREGRTQETNFGSYIAAMMVRTAKLLPDLEAKNGPVNIALTNSGSIRANIEPGNVTYGDVLTALPFRNLLTIQALTGEQLKQVLTHSVSGILEQEGFFLQMAGVRLFHRGEEFVAAKLLSEDGTTSDIDPKKLYNIATLDFIGNGGDGYTQFKGAPEILINGNEIGDLMILDLQRAMPNAIKVPDVNKTRHIVDCNADYVKCGDPTFAPCCANGKLATSPGAGIARIVAAQRLATRLGTTAAKAEAARPAAAAKAGAAAAAAAPAGAAKGR